MKADDTQFYMIYDTIDMEHKQGANVILFQQEIWLLLSDILY